MTGIARPSGVAGACIVKEVPSPPEAPIGPGLDGPYRSAPQEWGTADDDPHPGSNFKCIC